MKRVLTAGFILLAAWNGFGQGTLNFANSAFGVNAPVTSSPPTPALRVNDITVGEAPNGTTAVFTVSLTVPSAEIIAANFATSDGTAVAAIDYVPTNGIVIFAPGQTNRPISVQLYGDQAAEGTEVFFLTLSNPTGASLEKPQGTCTISDLYLTSLGFHVDVSFTTALNRRYRVESTVDGTNWATVPGAANVMGTGNIRTIVHSNASCQVQRLYRVLQLP